MTHPRKVFGIGFNKTGTSTLGKCFEVLGLTPVASPQAIHDRYLADGGPDQDLGPLGAYPFRTVFDEVCRHRNYELAIGVARDFVTFHDRPWNVADLYQSLDTAFPGSRFILTWREPESWWKSTEHWLNVSHPDDHVKLGYYLRHLHTDRVDRDSFIEGYRAHNAGIRAYFGGRTDFLDINFEDGDGWERLCPFLGLPAPAVPFPHEKRQRYRLT